MTRPPSFLPRRPSAAFVRGAFAAALLLLPGAGLLQARHDGPADLRCLSNGLAERAEALRESFDDDLRHSGSWPPRGCDRELAELLSDFACLADRLSAAVAREADPRQVASLWEATRTTLEAIREEFPRIRVSDPTRHRFAEAGEAACRFGRAWEEAGFGAVVPDRFSQVPVEPGDDLVVVEEAPPVVSVIRPPTLEEQAVGLIFQAIALGLQDRGRPGCRH